MTSRFIRNPVTRMVRKSLVKTDPKNRLIFPLAIVRIFSYKDVPGTPHRFDEGGVLGIISEFLAQAAHGDVHGAIERIRVHPPQGLHDLVPVQNLADIKLYERIREILDDGEFSTFVGLWQKIDANLEGGDDGK